MHRDNKGVFGSDVGLLAKWSDQPLTISLSKAECLFRDVLHSIMISCYRSEVEEMAMLDCFDRTWIQMVIATPAP